MADGATCGVVVRFGYAALLLSTENTSMLDSGVSRVLTRGCCALTRGYSSVAMKEIFASILVYIWSPKHCNYYHYQDTLFTCFIVSPFLSVDSI